VRDPGEFEQVFASATRQRAGALLVVQERLFVSHRQRIVELAARKRLPAMYGQSHFVDARLPAPSILAGDSYSDPLIKSQVLSGTKTEN
jgi:hypothetical protein